MQVPPAVPEVLQGVRLRLQPGERVRVRRLLRLRGELRQGQERQEGAHVPGAMARKRPTNSKINPFLYKSSFGFSRIFCLKNPDSFTSKKCSNFFRKIHIQYYCFPGHLLGRRSQLAADAHS